MIPGLFLKFLFHRLLNGVRCAFYIAPNAANRIGTRSQCEGTENNSNWDKAGQFHSGLSDRMSLQPERMGTHALIAPAFHRPTPNPASVCWP
jgi:hypothetical protein